MYVPAMGRRENATLPSGHVVDLRLGGVAIAAAAAFVAVAVVAVVDESADEASDAEGAIATLLLVTDSNNCLSSARRLLVVLADSLLGERNRDADLDIGSSSSCSFFCPCSKYRCSLTTPRCCFEAANNLIWSRAEPGAPRDL